MLPIYVIQMGLHLIPVMIRVLSLIHIFRIEYTGLRPGEKLYEEVLSNKENTEPTLHDRIRIAKVREYDYLSLIHILCVNSEN